MKKISIKLTLIVLAIVVLAIVFRPFVHPLLMSFVVSPLKAILLIFVIVGIFLIAKTIGPLKTVQISPSNYTFKTTQKVHWGIVAGYFVLIIAIMIGLFLESEIRLLLTAKSVDFDKITALPAFEPLRLTPKPVAKRYADDSFQNSQEYLGDSQIILDNGKLERVFPRLPDGTILYFMKKLSGFVTVEVDTLDRKVSISNQEFKYAEHIGIFDNIYYQLNLKKYFVNYSSEPIYLKDDAGRWVTVVPYMKYRGFPFTVPYWAGVMVVQSDGTMTDYTPEQAAQISCLKGNRLQPKEIVNYYTQSYSYKDGLINKWFVHKDQIEVVNLPSDEQIIHVPTADGFKQMVVAEPYGRSYGIYKIFLYDATTGKREVMDFDQNSQLTGPVSAADYIKKEYPSYSWDTFGLSEPRPLTINGDLYWMLSVIPNDNAGIAKTVVLNTKTNKVTGFDNIGQINAFIATGVASATTTTVDATSVDAKTEIQNKIDTIQTELNDLKALINK